MSLPQLVNTDFTGVYRIAQSNEQGDILTEFITFYEEKYLGSLLSDEIYQEIRDQTPLEQKYIDLMDGVDYTNTDGDLVTSKGFKQVLLALIYFHFVADNWINTPVGNVTNLNENANNLARGANSAVAKGRYNKGAAIYNNDILPFLNNYDSISTEITSSVDNTGTYTINTASTLYLVDGDTVTIGNTEYTVSGLVADTSFVITEATPGLDFAGDDFAYEPFSDFNILELSAAWL